MPRQAPGRYPCVVCAGETLLLQDRPKGRTVYHLLKCKLCGCEFVTCEHPVREIAELPKKIPLPS